MVGGVRAVVGAALEILESNRVATLIDTAPIETVSVMLEQAGLLAAKGYPAPAAVLAGGAVETHLPHLCERAGCVPAGDGSISENEAALAAARESGAERISQTDGNLVAAWGAMNDTAAKAPEGFVPSAQEVWATIQSVWEFLARNP